MNYNFHNILIYFMLLLTLYHFNYNLDILGEGDSDDSSDGDDDDDDNDDDDEGEGQGIVQLHFVTFEERSYSLSLEHYGIYTVYGFKPRPNRLFHAYVSCCS